MGTDQHIHPQVKANKLFLKDDLSPSILRQNKISRHFDASGKQNSCLRAVRENLPQHLLDNVNPKV